MDVAVFVGFAARGPLQRPVRVEAAAQFEMIFATTRSWRGMKCAANRCTPISRRPCALLSQRRTTRVIIRVAAQARSNYFRSRVSCTFNSMMLEISQS